jgi:hypothetical protein
MAIDYIVSLECGPKRHFGGGDAARGQLEILERLKSRNRAQAVREMIRQNGLPDTNPTISVQPPGTTGAKLCAEFMDQFKVTGEAIRELRGGGFYESTQAGSVPLVKGLFKSKSLSADQLLQTIFMVGEWVEPGHCFGILIWLGAIRVDGRVPSSPEDRAVIETLLALTTVEEKSEHTALGWGRGRRRGRRVFKTW